MREKRKTEKRNRMMYRKPQIEKVELVVEEAVLTSCKVKAFGPGSVSGCSPKPGSECNKARGRS